GISAAVRHGSGEDIVLVRRIADALERLVLLGEYGGLGQVVADASGVERVAVQVGHILRHHRTAGVVPRTLADAIARIHSRLTGNSLRAQISVPGAIPRVGRRRQRLAVLVRAGQAAIVGAVALRGAGYKERHWLRWPLALY